MTSTGPTPSGVAPAGPGDDWTVLRRDGVAVVVEHPLRGLALVHHWGADLGPLDAASLAGLAQAKQWQTPPRTLDTAPWPSLLPRAPRAQTGRRAEARTTRARCRSG